MTLIYYMKAVALDYKVKFHHSRKANVVAKDKEHGKLFSFKDFNRYMWACHVGKRAG